MVVSIANTGDGVLCSIQNAKCWPILARFDYFVTMSTSPWSSISTPWWSSRSSIPCTTWSGGWRRPRSTTTLKRSSRGILSSGKTQQWEKHYVINLPTCAYFHPSLDARRKKTFLDKLNSLLHSHQPWDCVKTWRERLIREDFTIFHHYFAQYLEIYHSFRKLTSYRFFFNCSAQISVLKRKRLYNQRGSFVHHQEFHGTESLIGCPSFFILVLKIGRTS